MFQASTTCKPVTFDADPLAYHAPQKAKRGEKDFIMSRSELEKFAACPRKWIRGIPNDATKAMRWGGLLDTVVLTPQHVEKAFAITPETYETDGMKCPKCGSVTDSQKCAKCKVDRVKSKVVKEWSANSDTCREWIEKEELAGRTVISRELLSDAWKANARLLDDPEIKSILDCSDRQVWVNVDWHDEATGIVVPFKCLLDLVPKPASKWGDSLWDLKTCADASGEKWARTVYNENYAFQMAIYMDALNAAGGFKYRSGGHVLSESSDPWEPAHRLLSEEFLQLGRSDYRAALARYCRCLKSGIFPGYDSDLVEPTAWMIRNPI